MVDLMPPNYAAAQAETMRKQADRLDEMARSAERDGDKWDACDLRIQAAEKRRRARRFEHGF